VIVSRPKIYSACNLINLRNVYKLTQETLAPRSSFDRFILLFVFSHIDHDSNLILKLILLNYQNNYVGRSNQLLEHQNFLQYCSLFLRCWQNYFQICIQQILTFISAKSFFPYREAKNGRLKEILNDLVDKDFNKEFYWIWTKKSICMNE